MLSKTSSKLLALIILFIIGFILLISVNMVFTNLMIKLDNKTKTYEQKIQIGEFIAEDIQKIKALFFELGTASISKRKIKLVNNEIYKNLNTISEALDVLQNSGVLKRVIKLNVVGHLSTVKVIDYKKHKNDKLSLEVIDLRPKIDDIKDMLKNVNKILLTRSKYIRAHEITNYYKEDRKVRRFYKNKSAFFARMTENIRRLLYESDKTLKVIEVTIIRQKQEYQRIKIAIIVSVILIVLIFGYKIIQIINKENDLLQIANDKLQIQERSIRAILDAQPNIIIVSNGEQMIDTNEAFFRFFTDFHNLEDFKKQHPCVCDFFEFDNLSSQEYLRAKVYENGVIWTDYILQHPEINFKALVKYKGQEKHFSVLVNQTSLSDKEDDYITIVSLNDITKEIEAQLHLAKLNNNLELIVAEKTRELQDLNENLEQKIIIESNKAREKDKQLIQQSRFAAMGEMIGNIAHQWRQPLSAINTTASGMKLQIELGITDNDEISESYDRIMNYVDFLTQTIEDFRGFFKEDKQEVKFKIANVINKTLSITSAVYKDNDISLINSCEGNDKFESIGMPSELSQVFLNILNNAKDAILENDIEYKFVHIRCEEDEQYYNIYIQDNAGGIPPKIIEKVFDPYFTTKHQSQGTGIGLYMSKDIVEKHLDGVLSVQNKYISLDGIDYNGASFKISIPKA